MGKFFANQKQDTAGLVGITLQKLLIFFMVLDVISMFFSGSFFTAFLTLLFHFVVFMGVYRRRTAVLCIYVVIHIVLFVLVALVLIVAVSSLMYMPPMDYSSSGEFDNGSVTHNSTVTYLSTRALKFLNHYSNNTRNSTHPTPHGGIVYEDSSAYSSTDIEIDSSAVFLFSVIFLVLFFIIMYTKILSVVLAHRMRKLLLAAPTLPVSADAHAQTMEPTYVPSDFENQQQFFGNPAFMPYAPMVPQDNYPGQQGAMMPPPFMYGQQPVFYTFAPMPPMEERNEKL